MLSITSETLIQYVGAKFASDKAAEREQAAELLELMLDQDETATIHLLEEQLQRDPDPILRRGYVLALKESLSPSAVIILLRALHYESDPTVWQTILLVLRELQPTRSLLENLTVTGIDFSIRKEAAEMLLGLARRDGRSIPKSTADRLISFLGSSEEISYPTQDVLSESGGMFTNALTAALINFDSAPYAHTIFQNTQPESSWRRILYPSIDFPKYCQIGKTERMTVKLVITTGDVDSQPINVAFRPEETEITLNVFVSSNDLTVEQNWGTINVYHTGNSTEASFQISPLQEGRAHLTVEFFKEGQRIGLLMVRTFVSDPNKPSDQAAPSAIESDETYRWLTQQVISLENPVLHINETHEGLTFLAHARSSPNPGDHVEWLDPMVGAPAGISSQVPMDWQNFDEYFDRFRIETAEALETTGKLEAKFGRSANAGIDKSLMNNPEYQKYREYLEFMLLDLKSVGKELFSDALSPEIRERVRALEPGTPLNFRSDEKLAWIPWELVYDADRKAFWGELFPIARLATPLSGAQGHRREAGTRGSPTPEIINVAGDRLGKPADLVNLLKRAFKDLPTRGNVVTPFKEYSVSQFIEVIREGTLVHLTCIGERDRKETYYLRLGPEIIHRFKSRHVKHIEFSFQPLVFTNACSTVSGFMTLRGYSNLAWEIYQRGAGAYIGTIAPVPASHAISFAETVYDELINNKKSIGEALWHAKRIFSKEEPLHPFYLLYCLYGNSQWRWPRNAGAVEAQQANR